MQLTGFTRGSDPIKNRQLCEHISDEIEKPVDLYVTPTEVVVWGDDIAEPDRTSIQTAIDNYTYIPEVGPVIQGPPGSPGSSAYEIWLGQGNEGTEQDFLDSLQGDPGVDGSPGEDGSPGQNGSQGIQGPPGTTSWNGITDKPASFTPSSHSHPISEVTNLQSSLDSKAASGHNHDGVYATAAHTHAGLPSYALLANGATAMALATNPVVKVTPTATATFTTTVPPAGTHCHIIILTSGTVSRTITFGTGFKPVGTLATGTVSARVFVIGWVSDGTNLYETGRTAAMVA